MKPSANGANGRDGQGRFALGNPGGPGNPLAKRVAHARATIHETVSDDDLRDVIRALVELAKGGDLAAIREVFDRLCGKVRETADPFESVKPSNLTQINIDARDLTDARREDMAAWLKMVEPVAIDQEEGP